MVDTTPLNQDPQGDEPTLDNTELDSTAAPIEAADAPAAPAPAASSAPTPVTSHRSRRGLVLAGSIVAAVIVLGGTFGGGVLVGTSVTGNHGISDAQRGPGGAGFPDGTGAQGGPAAKDGPGRQGPQRDGGTGTRPDGGPRGGSDTDKGSTNG
jgi:hypothetical protein